jgi:hypothetical protein
MMQVEVVEVLEPSSKSLLYTKSPNIIYYNVLSTSNVANKNLLISILSERR